VFYVQRGPPRVCALGIQQSSAHFQVVIKDQGESTRVCSGCRNFEYVCVSCGRDTDTQRSLQVTRPQLKLNPQTLGSQRRRFANTDPPASRVSAVASFMSCGADLLPTNLSPVGGGNQVATIRRCNREQLQSGTTVSITPLPPSQSLPFFPWDGRSPVSHPTCDVPFPPRRPGEYWKGMIPDRPLYQGVRGFVWDPKPRESGSVIWADRRRTGPTCVWPKGGPQGQTESGGIVLAATCWATSAQRRFHPKEALYLPTFSHLLIVNKLLSLSLSPHIGITSMHYPPLMHPIHNTRIKIDPGGG
jgi:hypothetical protein